VDKPHHMVEKGSGARRGIENPCVQIRQSQRASKLVLQNPVHRPDYVGDNRLGGVVDAPLRLRSRIIFAQESFVEVDHGIFLARAPPEVFEDGRHVSMFEKFYEFIHQPRHPVIQVRPSYIMEQVSQKRVGTGQILGGRPPAKAFGIVRHGTGGK